MKDKSSYHIIYVEFLISLVVVGLINTRNFIYTKQVDLCLALQPLNHPSNNLRPAFRYGDIILFSNSAPCVAHLVAEEVGGDVLLGEASAVGVAEIVVFEVDA